MDYIFLGFPVFFGLLLPPILLVLSILYALISIKKFPISSIPIASFVFLALLLCVFAPVIFHIGSAKTEAMLQSDGIAVVNMIKNEELHPDEYGRVYLPTEYQHLLNLNYAIVGYTVSDSLCIAFDCTVGILVERRAYLYSEEVICAGDYISNLYELESVVDIIPNWYLVKEINYSYPTN